MYRLLLSTLLIVNIGSHASVFQVDKKASFCPPPSFFKRDPKTLIWYGPDNWKSFNPSFAVELTRFRKAQWQGTNVGVILCTYDTNNKSAFPVFIQAPGSYAKPKKSESVHWLEKNQVLTCTASYRTSCPFYRIREHTVKLEKKQDLVEFLSEVKKNYHPLPNMTDL